MVDRYLTDEEFAAKMERRRMTTDGKEIPDPRPVRPSVKVQRQPSMFDIHRMRMQQEVEFRRFAEMETEDDMNDFGDEDEDVIERLSEYERGDLEVTLREEERRMASKSERKPPAPSGGEAPGGGAKPADAPVDPPEPKQ